jgi:NDP-sugar pyrophosphorylase family protein
MLILAGGLGTRLRQVVSDRPKPLAIVGNQPIIQTIISRAVESGIRKFHVAVNYMSDLIEKHLAGPQYSGLDISIVKESKRLGTAGALGLIQQSIDEPLLVCNADLLTTVPLQQIIRHHRNEKADVTCTVRPYSTKIPFGVVEIKGRLISNLVEKPEATYLVNAGIYVLNPDVCKLVPMNEYLDMPDLIMKVMKDERRRVVPFLLHEYWMDIGKPDDFMKANEEFSKYFGDLQS